MLTIFSGDDTFRSRAAFRAARAQAAAAARAPVTLLRDEALTPTTLEEALAGQTLFGASPPVAVERLTRFTGDAAGAVARTLQAAPRNRTLLVWEEGVPPANGIVWRALVRLADAKAEFVPLSPRATLAWIRTRLQESRCTIEPAAAERLLGACGADLACLASELEKLVLAVEDGVITAAHVDALTPARVAADIFVTIRALAHGTGEEALRLLTAHARSGEEPRRIFSLVLREVRHLLRIRDGLDRGERLSPWGLARELRIPSTAAGALLRSARGTTTATVRDLFDRLVVAAYHLNTGRAEADEVLGTLALQLALRSPVTPTSASP